MGFKWIIRMNFPSPGVQKGECVLQNGGVLLVWVFHPSLRSPLAQPLAAGRTWRGTWPGTWPGTWRGGARGGRGGGPRASPAANGRRRWAGSARGRRHSLQLETKGPRCCARERRLLGCRRAHPGPVPSRGRHPREAQVREARGRGTPLSAGARGGKEPAGARARTRGRRGAREPAGQRLPLRSRSRRLGRRRVRAAGVEEGEGEGV